MSLDSSVAIIGGGVAGLAAAVRLHQAGCRVTLIEARNRLGGRATSFTDPATGETIDNCQHVVLGCCTNLLDFYRRLGVAHRIQWHDEMFFASAEGTMDTLRASILPAPAHLALSLMRFSAFNWREKAALTRAMRAIASVSRDDFANLTFDQWLLRRGQSERLIRRFWDVVIISACNLPCSRVSAGPALQVFQEGFLAHRKAWRLGLPQCPLVELYDPAAAMIDDLRLGRRVVSINGTKTVESITLDTGETLTADACICAVPFEHLTNLLSRELQQRDARIGQTRGLTHSPILGVHLRFERPVSSLPHVAMLDAAVQWVFFKDEGRSAHAVVSAADEWMALSPDEIVSRVRTELERSFPEIGPESGNELVGRHVVKEKRATFAATPESQAHRPEVVGDVANLYLAGDYCRTGWPATMEGAARSGYAAAAAILGRDLAVPDLRPALFYRAMRRFPKPRGPRVRD